MSNRNIELMLSGEDMIQIAETIGAVWHGDHYGFHS